MDKKREIGDSIHDKNLEAFIDELAKLEIDKSNISEEDIQIIEEMDQLQALYAICFLKIIQKEDDFNILKKLKLSSSFYKVIIQTLKEKDYFNKMNDLQSELLDSMESAEDEEKSYKVNMYFLKGYDYIMYNYSDYNEEELEVLSNFINSCGENNASEIQEDINKSINKINTIIKTFNENIGKWSKSRNQNVLTLLSLSDDMISASHNLIKQIQSMFFHIESQEMMLEDMLSFLDENNLMEQFDKFCKEKSDEE